MSFQCRINMLKKQLIQLIKARGAIAQEITDYNFRSYFVRRANEDVETLEKDESVEVTNEMVANLNVWNLLIG